MNRKSDFVRSMLMSASLVALIAGSPAAALSSAAYAAPAPLLAGGTAALAASAASTAQMNGPQLLGKTLQPCR